MNAPAGPGIPASESSGAAWAIPEPGNLGVGDVVDAGVRLWFGNWARLTMLGLILSGAVTIVATATGGLTLGGLIEWFQDGANVKRLPQPTPLSTALGQAQAWILGPILMIALFRTSLGAAAGSRPSLRRTLHLGLTRLPQGLWLVVAQLIVFVGISGGAAVLMVIGVGIAGRTGLVVTLGATGILMFAIYARLSIAAAALVMEDRRGFKALGRSWDLTSGKAWRTMAVLLLSAVIVFGGSVAGVLLDLAVPGTGTGVNTLRAVLQAVVTASVAPLGHCILSVLYLDLVARPRGGLRADEARAWLGLRDPA